MAKFVHDPISAEEIQQALEQGPTLSRFARGVQQLSRQLLLERIKRLAEPILAERQDAPAHMAVWAAMRGSYSGLVLAPEQVRELEVLYVQSDGWWLTPEDPSEEEVFLDTVDWQVYLRSFGQPLHTGVGQ